MPDPGTGADTPIWVVMQKQAEAAHQKDQELRAREEALKALGIDPRAPEYESLRMKHFEGQLHEKKENGPGEAIWEVMSKQAAYHQRWLSYLAELEEIASQRGL